jgi:hypothetical protein
MLASKIFGILVCLTASYLCDNNNRTSSSPIITTTISPTTTTTTTSQAAPKVWDTCNIGAGSLREQSLLANLTAIKGDHFYYQDMEHAYYFTVCARSEQADLADQGFVQQNRASGKKFVLGRLNDVDLEGILEGNQKFIRLTYKNGDEYKGSCGKTSRNAIVYIFCHRTISEFKMIEENNGRDNNQCGYVFQLNTPKMCPLLETSCNVEPTRPAQSTTTANNPKAKGAGMGVVAIILTVVFSVLCVYLIVGTLFQRFVRQARGWEQLPNWSVWNSLAQRCPCSRRNEPSSYENIIDHASDDENLLNM